MTFSKRNLMKGLAGVAVAHTAPAIAGNGATNGDVYLALFNIGGERPGEGIDLVRAHYGRMAGHRSQSPG